MPVVQEVFSSRRTKMHEKYDYPKTDVQSRWLRELIAEDNDAVGRKDNVRAARQSRDVKPVAEAAGPQLATQN